MLNDKESRTIYDHEYVSLYQKKKGEGRLERLIHLIDFQQNDVVLDLGCGSGFLLDLIHDKVKRYVGIDISEEFIAEATFTHATIENASFVCEGPGEHSHQNCGTYTKICMMDVVEHLYDKQFVSVLADCKKMLKNRGKIYVHTPNRDYFWEYLKEKGILKQTKGHVRVRNIRQYEQIIKTTGFSNFHVYFLNHYLKVLKPFHLFSCLPFFGSFFKARLFIEILHND